MASVALDKVVRDVCEKFQDYNYSRYMEVLRDANRVVKRMYLHLIPSKERYHIKSSFIDQQANRAITMPDDYVYYTKIGVCKNNHIVTLGLDESLCNEDDRCPNEDQASDEINFRTYPYNWYYPFYNVSTNVHHNKPETLYGYGGGKAHYGYYNVDESSNPPKIIFSKDVPQDAQIVVEYKSDGVGDGAELVDTEAEHCIFYNCMAHQYLSREKAGMYDRMMRQYQVEWNLLKKMYNSLTASEWHDLILKNTKSTVKR